MSDRCNTTDGKSGLLANSFGIRTNQFRAYDTGNRSEVGSLISSDQQKHESVCVKAFKNQRLYDLSRGAIAGVRCFLSCSSAARHASNFYCQTSPSCRINDSSGASGPVRLIGGSGRRERRCGINHDWMGNIRVFG